MFTPEQMDQIHVVFSDRDAEPVSEAVVRHGALQPMEPAELETWQRELLKPDSGQESPERRALRERVEGLLKRLGIPVSAEGADPAGEPWNVLEDRIDRVDRQVSDFDLEHRKLEDELKRLDELSRRVRDVPHLGLPLKNIESASYLAIEYGALPSESTARLEEKLKSVMHILYPAGTSEGRKTVLVIGLSRDRDRIRQALSSEGFQAIPVSEVHGVKIGSRKDADGFP